MRLTSVALLAGLLTVQQLANAQKPPGDPYAAEFKKLSESHTAAVRAYLEPLLKARTEAERNTVELNPAKNPGPKFFPKFRALAKKAAGTPTGAQATLQVIRLGMDAGDRESVRAAYTELFTRYPASREAEMAVDGLQYNMPPLTQADARRMLRGLVEGKTPGNLKAAALYALAGNLEGNRAATPAEKSEAKSLFALLEKNHPDSRYAARLHAAAFERENLQIGKVAPDFEATDENGKRFKLSDYRGKVVVLDFWGWW